MFLDSMPKPRLDLLDTTKPPSLVISKGTAAMHPASFEEASQKRLDIERACLIWNTNSYFIDVHAQEFVVNGGRKIRFDEEQVTDPVLLLVRRHIRKVSMGGTAHLEERVSYLIGYEGMRGGAKHEVFAHVSPDGSEFRFENKR